MKNKTIIFVLITFLLFSVSPVYASNVGILCGIEDIPEALPIFISNLINLVKIMIPILLIIMGMIDFLQAVIASDDKKMKESQTRFIRRMLAAILVFMVVAIVQFVFGLVKTDKGTLRCVNCFVNGNCNLVEKRTCSDYDKQNICPYKDDNNNMCKWKDEKCQTNGEAKYCRDYSKDKCPANDDYGYTCKVGSESGIPKCLSYEKAKYCIDYSIDECPANDAYGYNCEVGNESGMPKCLSKDRNNN